MADDVASTETAPAKSLDSALYPDAPKDEGSTEDSGDKDSGKTDKAQDQTKPDTDGMKKDDQDSVDGKSEDTDKKDAEDKEKKDGDAEAQFEPFTLPEGLELDEAAMGEALPVFKELGVTQEQGQKFIDIASTMVSKTMKHVTDVHTETVAAWGEQTEKLFGGEGKEAFAADQVIAEGVIKHFFKSPEDLKILTHHGFGNHPGVFGMALAIGKATSEDKGSGGGEGGVKNESEAANRKSLRSLYPSTEK